LWFSRYQNEKLIVFQIVVLNGFTPLEDNGLEPMTFWLPESGWIEKSAL